MSCSVSITLFFVTPQSSAEHVLDKEGITFHIERLIIDSAEELSFRGTLFHSQKSATITVLEHFIAPKRNSIPIITPHFPPTPEATTTLLSVFIDLHIWAFHRNEIQYTVFCPRLFHLAYVHPCCSMDQHFIPLYGQIIFHCMDIPQFVHPFIN